MYVRISIIFALFVIVFARFWIQSFSKPAKMSDLTYYEYIRPDGFGSYSYKQSTCLEKMSKTFYYFAYGSNLLAQRIHMNSPSAIRKGCGKLKDYRLDFNTYSNRWKGASATVVAAKNQTVWGAIWEIGIENMANLDKQEGVDQKIYFAFETNIETPEGNLVKCRLYQQCQTPPPLNDNQVLPPERRPSATYLNTIIKGAEESNLPENYQKYLQSIPHNGYDGPANLVLLLDE